LGDCGLPQIQGANGSRVQVAVHPNEGSAISRLPGGRVAPHGESAVQTPSDEDPLALGINVGETTAIRQHRERVRENSRDSQPSRRLPKPARPRLAMGDAKRQAPARVPARQARVPAPHKP
jgi:hypothetical protein